MISETSPREVAIEAVSEVLRRLEEAVEVLTGREAGTGQRTFAAEVGADTDIEHVQRAYELMQESTGEVGRALWFLRRAVNENA